MNARCRRQWHLILLIINQLLLFKIFAQPVEQKTTTERLSTEIDYEEIKDDLNKKLLAVDRLKIGGASVVARSDVRFSDHELEGCLRELRERYQGLLANATLLAREIQNGTMNAFDTKSMLDLIEKDISEVFDRGGEEVCKEVEKADGEAFDNSVTQQLELLRSLHYQIKELQRLNNKRKLEFEQVFSEAMLNGQYELAALKLNTVKHDSHTSALLTAAYLKQQHIDGLLYLGSNVSDYRRRLLIFKTAHKEVMKNIKSEVCDLLKIIYRVDKELPEVLANDTEVFQQMFSLKIQAESDALVRIQQMEQSSSKQDVYIQHQDLRKFLVYTKLPKQFHLLHMITYTVSSDPNDESVIRCSGVKIGA